MQDVSSLHQEKASADLEAGQWKARFVAAQDRDASANARVSQLERRLQAESAEADKLRLSSVQQRQVSTQVSHLQKSCCLNSASRVEQREHLLCPGLGFFMCVRSFPPHPMPAPLSMPCSLCSCSRNCPKPLRPPFDLTQPLPYPTPLFNPPARTGFATFD